MADRDDMFEIAANRRRRALLMYLDNHDSPILRRPEGRAVREAAHNVAKQINRDPEPSEEQIRNVYISMQQTHLPKMVEAGCIELDQELNVIHITDWGRRVGDWIRDGVNMPRRRDDHTAWEFAGEGE